ncbi:hypothetical protein PspLS_05157 [Pyricularia sp. CBS 133598]|nr:hypothetical protein PspLS_05157 [Pyricularia sp. CBS 133598]
MHPNTILLITAGLLDFTAAFRCPAGLAASCTFRKSPTEQLTKCAVSCTNRLIYSECTCPLNFPNRADWIYTDRNDCITQTQFAIRSQCQNADPRRVRTISRVMRKAESESESEWGTEE